MRFLGQKPGSILFALPPKKRAWMGHISLPEPMDTFEIWPTPTNPDTQGDSPFACPATGHLTEFLPEISLVHFQSPPFHHCGVATQNTNAVKSRLIATRNHHSTALRC
jgi:hypothetical protein